MSGPIRTMLETLKNWQAASGGVLTLEDCADMLDRWAKLQNGPQPSTEDSTFVSMPTIKGKH